MDVVRNSDYGVCDVFHMGTGGWWKLHAHHPIIFAACTQTVYWLMLESTSKRNVCVQFNFCKPPCASSTAVAIKIKIV